MSQYPIYADPVMVPTMLTKQQMTNLREIVELIIGQKQKPSGSEEIMVSLIGREYVLRKQRPFQKHPPLFTFISNDWKLIFNAGPTYPNTITTAIWNVKFGGNEGAFDNDLVMLRVGL